MSAIATKTVIPPAEVLRIEQLAEEYEWLAQGRVSHIAICHRLGVSEDAMSRALLRRGGWTWNETAAVYRRAAS